MATGKAAKKAGRPVKSDGKHETLTLRASTEERELFETAAAKDRRPLAQWMRDRLVTAAQSELK